MNKSPNRLGAPLAVAVVLLAFGAVAAVWLSERSKHAGALAELRREVADLRAQLEARGSAVSSSPTEVPQGRGGAVSVGSSTTSSPDLELVRQVAALALQQSNIAVVVERALARTVDAQAPAVSAQSREAAYAALEAAAQEQQQRLEAITQKAAELLFSLSIPAEISTMDATKALDTASLRTYWPYFETKRERDSMRLFAERVQMRLIQERMDARIERAR